MKQIEHIHILLFDMCFKRFLVNLSHDLRKNSLARFQPALGHIFGGDSSINLRQ